MKRLILAIALLNLFPFAKTQATVWYVNQAATGTSLGTSWTNAFKDLQAAIVAAGSGDTIWVAKGNYMPTQPADGSSVNNRDKAFVLKNNVHLYGGFAGTETALSARLNDSTSLFVTNATVLNGDLGTPNDSTDNAYHVVISSALSAFTMDGFSITNGNANGTTPITVNGRTIYRHYAGGVYNDSTTGVYKNVLILKNAVRSFDDEEGGGGGMYNYKGSVTVQQATFKNNHAEDCNGGALKNYSSSAVIAQSTFVGNTCISDDEGGGAVNNKEQSNGTFTDILFDANYTNASGGAIYNDNSSAQFTNVVFNNNTAEGSGGGMDTDNFSHATLTHVVFSNNHSDDDGGGLFGWKSNVTLNDVSFYNNYAANNGGGMYNYNTCNPKITDAQFYYNSAGNHYGGFGLERNGTATLTNVVFARNNAVNNGGGMGCHDNHGTAATAILTNVTIVNNKASNAGGNYDMGTTSQLRNSIIIGNYPNDVAISTSLVSNTRRLITTNATAAPIWIVSGNTAPAGTPVSWPFFVDTATSNYQLVTGSPAIDAGDSSFYAVTALPNISMVTTDIRKAKRIMGNNVDLGAYEYCTQTVFPSASLIALPGTSVSNGTSITFTVQSNNVGNTPRIEWYKNTTKIMGASGVSYTGVAGTDFVNNDIIYAIVYASEACASPDSVITNKLTIHITVTGVPSIGNDPYQLSLYPNPNKGTFVVSGNLENNQKYEVTITSITGQRLMQVTRTPQNNVIGLQMPAAISAGLYILSVKEEGRTPQNLRFMVEE